MAKRIIDVLEPVEVEHDERAAAFCGFIGRENALELFVHSVAIGKAGQRVIFGKSRVDQFALIFDRDILGAATITLKFARFVKFGMAGNRPPCLTAFIFCADKRKANGLVNNLIVSGQLEIQRSIRPFARIIGVGFKQFD